MTASVSKNAQNTNTGWFEMRQKYLQISEQNIGPQIKRMTFSGKWQEKLNDLSVSCLKSPWEHSCYLITVRPETTDRRVISFLLSFTCKIIGCWFPWAEKYVCLKINKQTKVKLFCLVRIKILNSTSLHVYFVSNEVIIQHLQCLVNCNDHQTPVTANHKRHHTAVHKIINTKLWSKL